MCAEDENEEQPCQAQFFFVNFLLKELGVRDAIKRKIPQKAQCKTDEIKPTRENNKLLKIESIKADFIINVYCFNLVKFNNTPFILLSFISQGYIN